MFFKKKNTNRLYIPTKTRWYRRPKRDTSHLNTRKIFSHNIRTHLSRLVKDAFLYIVAGVVFIGLIVLIIFSSKFSINEIPISRDNLNIDSAAVSDLMKVYKGKSIFFFSKTEAHDLIQKKYPEFSEITIKKLLPDQIKVTLKNHDIVANMKASYVLPKVQKEPVRDLTSDDKPSTSDNTESDPEKTASNNKDQVEEVSPVEQKALLNEIGQAIFSQDESLELMTITIKNLSQPIEDRQFAIPTNDMKYILDSIKYFTNMMNMEITAVTYLPIAREVHLTTEKNLTLWLGTDKDYKKQLDKFSTIYKVAELDKEDLAYADLRIDEKFIYCPRRAACDKLN